MAYDKTSCEKCGEMVSTYPPLKAKHDKNCTGSAKVEASDEVIVDAVAELPAPTDPVAQREMAMLDRDVLRAQKKAAILAKDAPKVTVGLGSGDDELVKLEKYARSLELIPDNCCVFFGDETKHGQYVGQGNIPVVIDGVHQRHGDLKMYYYPTVIRESRQRASGNLSRRRLQEHADQGNARDSGKVDPTTEIPE